MKLFIISLAFQNYNSLRLAHTLGFKEPSLRILLVCLLLLLSHAKTLSSWVSEHSRLLCLKIERGAWLRKNTWVLHSGIGDVIESTLLVILLLLGCSRILNLHLLLLLWLLLLGEATACANSEHGCLALALS